MTNAQVLAQGLADFESLEYEVQETIADYIECTNADDCAWDGKTEHLSVCTECKIRWLGQKWEG